jgi:hypothetical protein
MPHPSSLQSFGIHKITILQGQGLHVVTAISHINFQLTG